MKNDLPKIVLLGRPNVGKSTLFNRLIRSNRAITHDRPGITRDRMEGFVRKNGRTLFSVVDTGGVTLESQTTIAAGPAGIRGFEEAIVQQVHAALASASLIVFVVDGKDGLLPMDATLAELARRTNCPVLCVINKVDGEEHTTKLSSEFYSLGFPLIAISAAHGYHVPDLVSRIELMLGDCIQANDEEEKTDPLRLALLGRPNAGKSSLVNALCHEDRMIISDVPGTTRDSVDVFVRIGNEDFVFVDTAGVRRKTRIDDQVEQFSVNASIKSTTKADVTVLVVDVHEGLGSQDKHLIDLLDRRKTPFFIVLNKCDLLTERELTQRRSDIAQQLSFCAHIPLVSVSALTGRGLKKLIPLAKKIHQECAVRVSTGQLNRALQEILGSHQPPMVRRSRPRFFYVTQAESKPPTFVFFVSDATQVPESYMRYLERGLRKLFGILHAPVRIHLRSSHKK